MRALLASYDEWRILLSSRLPVVHENPSYSEKKTQSAPFSSNWDITVCLYQHSRAVVKDESRQTIRLSSDGHAFEAHESHTEDRHDSSRSHYYLHQFLGGKLHYIFQGLDLQRSIIHVQILPVDLQSVESKPVSIYGAPLTEQWTSGTFYGEGRVEALPRRSEAPTRPAHLCCTLRIRVKPSSTPTARLPPFRLVRSLQTPGYTIPAVGPIRPDIEHIYSAMSLLIRLICREARLKRMADTNLRQAQGHYKGEHKNGQVWTSICPRGLCLRQATTTNDNRHQTAVHRKLLETLPLSIETILNFKCWNRDRSHHAGWNQMGRQHKLGALLYTPPRGSGWERRAQ